MQKIICPECGAPNNSDATSCFECGYPLSNLIPQEEKVEPQVNNVVNNKPTPDTFLQRDTAISNQANIPEKIIHKGALVRCPGCGKDTYDEDEVCEFCGFPVRPYFEKQNKVTLADRINAFKLQDVWDYIDYVIYNAKNTVKIMVIAALADIVAIYLFLVMVISNLKMLISTVGQYNAGMSKSQTESWEELLRNQITSQSISLGISVVLFIALIIVGVILIKKLNKDYQEA